jgi:hypothetical protein
MTSVRFFHLMGLRPSHGNTQAFSSNGTGERFFDIFGFDFMKSRGSGTNG